MAITSQDLQDILVALDGGLSVPRIAEEWGFSPQAIYTALREANIDVKERRNSSLLDEDEAKNLVHRFEVDLASPTALAKEFHMSLNKVYAVLEQYNVDIAKVKAENKRGSTLRIDTAVEMYQNGAKLREIKAQTGIYPAQLYTVLTERSIPIGRTYNGPGSIKQLNAEQQWLKEGEEDGDRPEDIDSGVPAEAA
jgi:hypothetical protein